MSVAQYLERHADSDAHIASRLVGGPWVTAVVIPARLETSTDLVGAAIRLEVKGKLLVILILNHDPAQPEEFVAEEACHAELTALGKETVLGSEAWQIETERIDYLILRRNAAGVGAARRLGADVAMHLWADGRLESEWIHGTDADAVLPAEHHERVLARGVDRIVAAIAPFAHMPGEQPDVTAATWAYERSLRYYRLGLLHAGCPWAFHTIGSLISFRAPYYARVRGYPRRDAGEDFYLLAKLAKLGPVRTLGGRRVEIRARRSSRVPFGTGPAVERELLAEQPVYDPRCFEALGVLTCALRHAAGAPLDQLPVPLREVVHDLGIADSARRVLDRYPAAQHESRLYEVFDAFKTLKLIHGLSEHWPKIPWARAVATAPFLPRDLRNEVDWTQLRRLEALEEDLSRSGSRS